LSQSAIIKQSYEAIFQNLAGIGAETQLFTVKDGYKIKGEIGENKTKSVVFVEIPDLCQLFQDKNGEKIVFNEVSYEAPARIGFILSLTVVSKRHPDLLETAGYLIRHFKDNNVFFLEEYTWHGNDNGVIYIEPVIREPESNTRQPVEIPFLTLEYRIEVGINSEKGTPVRRVEKKTIKGNIIG
jgi:hypothetical protein